MPKKTVKEMNQWERAHYSIRSRTFKMILACGLIISVAAIAVGIFLYNLALRNQYVTIAHNIAKMPTMVFDESEGKAFADPVMQAYFAASGMNTDGENSEEYLNSFEKFYDSEYDSVREKLYEIEQKNDAFSVYLGAIDLKSKQIGRASCRERV